MHIQVTCGTVGSGTDGDPFRPYVAELWPVYSGLDMRDDPTVGEGPWIVDLVADPAWTPEQVEGYRTAVLSDPAVSVIE